MCSLIAAAAVPGRASANPVNWASSEVDLELVPAPAAASTDAPMIRATIVGRPIAQSGDVTLTDVGHAPIKASSVVAYRDGGEPITIAVVVQGGEVFMGNDDIEPEDSPARYPGALKGLVDAFDSAHLGSYAPPGSRAVAITYDDGAHVRMPLVALNELEGHTFGTQRDYYNRVGIDLVGGIDLAMSQLEMSNTPRRALIIIGDGNDTNNEAAAVELAGLKKRAAVDGVQTFAIIYKSALSEDGNVISRMVPNTMTVNSTESIGTKVVAIASALADRYYATFPTTTLDHDGRMHDLTLTVGNEAMDPVALTLPGEPSTAWHFSLRSAWTQLAIGGLLASLCVLALYVRGRMARGVAQSAAAE
jgi:hypothetical protein